MARELCPSQVGEVLSAATNARQERLARYAEGKRAPVAERVLLALSLAVCLALVCGLVS